MTNEPHLDPDSVKPANPPEEKQVELQAAPVKHRFFTRSEPTTVVRSEPLFQFEAKMIRKGWWTDRAEAFPVVIAPLFFGVLIGLRLESPCEGIGQSNNAAHNSQVLMASIATIIGFLAAFMAFSALTYWVLNKMPKGLWPAIITYSAVAFICGGVIFVFTPHFMLWLIFFAVLFSISTGMIWLGMEDNFIARFDFVVGNVMILPALADQVSGRVLDPCRTWSTTLLTDVPGLWMITAGLAAYYITVVPYMKTLTTAKNSQLWLLLSLVLHYFLLGVTIWGWWEGHFSIVAVAVWVVLLVRAIYMPVADRKREVPFTSRQINMPEAVYSIMMIIGLYLSIPDKF